MDVQIKRQSAFALHRTGNAVTAAGDHPDLDPALLIFGQGGAGNIAIPGRAHLVLGRQVQPELEAFHQAFFLLGHFAVDDAAAGSHPLHIAIAQQPFVAGRITVPHTAFEHIGDGLEPPVRMVGEAADIVAGLLGAEGIEHQEGVEPALQILRQHASQLDPGAIAGGEAGDQAFDQARLGQRGIGCVCHLEVFVLGLAGV